MFRLLPHHCCRWPSDNPSPLPSTFGAPCFTSVRARTAYLFGHVGEFKSSASGYKFDYSWEKSMRRDTNNYVSGAPAITYGANEAGLMGMVLVLYACTANNLVGVTARLSRPTKTRCAYGMVWHVLSQHEFHVKCPYFLGRFFLLAVLIFLMKQA